LEGSAPERSVLLALEALEHYPYTWQAERALSQAILNNRLRLLLNHDDFVQTAEWSADGSKILTAAGDGTVRVWDALNGVELLRITEGAPKLARWSPDERLILTVDEEDLTAKIWDVATRSERLTLNLKNINGGIEINRYEWEPWSPSGDHILLYFGDGTVKIWDAENGEALQTLAGHQGWVSEALWSPGGDLIASSGWEDGQVIVWQVENGQAVHTIQAGFEDERVFVGNWSPSGDRFTIHGLGGTKVYDVVTGNQLLNLIVPNVWINRVVWSPDGEQILTSGKEDGVARIWDAENGQEIIQMTGFTQTQASDWALSGDFVAVADVDGSVRVRDMVKDAEVLEFSTAPTVFIVAFSSDGERLFAVGWDNAVKVYDLSEALLSISLPAGVVSNVEWSPTGEYIAFSVGEDTVKVWDSFNGEEQISLPGHEGNLSYVKWSPCGDRILSLSDGDNLAKVWDASTGEQQLIFAGHEEITFAGGWSPDCSRIVTSDFGGDVIVWDSVTGDEIQTLTGHQYWGWNAAWSPDGTRILSTDDHGKATIWDLASGEVLLDLFPEDFTLGIRAASWSKDGSRVILQSVDGVIHIFDSHTGDDLMSITTPIWGMRVSLSPSEERLITGGAGGNAMVWDTGTGEELIRYDVGGWIDAAYSPDGARVLVGSTDGSLQVFPTWHSTQDLIDYAYDCCVFRQLSAEERELFGLPER
jgi:WD40 repeat protein